MEHITESGPDLRVTGSHWKKGKAKGQMGEERCLMWERGNLCLFLKLALLGYVSKVAKTAKQPNKRWVSLHEQFHNRNVEV